MSSIHELFKSIGIETSTGWTGNKKVKCPQCRDSRKAKNRSDKPLSINMETGKYNCHNCDFKGIVKETNTYKRPKEERLDLLPEVEQWLLDRELSLDAAKMFKVGSKEIQKRKCILFNYYNLFNQHSNVKVRDINDKKFMRQSGDAEKTPYGAQFIKGAPYIVITEGEPDVLAWATAGVYYAISGSNGASDDTWMNTIYKQLDEAEKIYIAVDGDEAGKKYEEKITRRIDKEKLFKIDYGIYKDANEVLIQNGQEAGSQILKEIFEGAEPYPVEEIDRVSKHMEDALHLFIHGYPDTYLTGVADLDKMFSLHLEDVTLITGTPNAGKSNFADWLVTTYAKRYGLKTGIFTGEKSIKIHLAGLVYKYLEKSREWMKPSEAADQQAFMEGIAHLHDHIFYYNEDVSNIDDILNYGRYMVKRYGINILLLDNWTVMDKSVPYGEDPKDYAGTMLGKMTKFSKKNKCHILLVAHPRKLNKLQDGTYEMPTGYDIYGTSHFYNLIDNGLSLRAQDGYTDIQSWKIRHQEFVGTTDFGRLSFNVEQGRSYGNFGATAHEFTDYINNNIDDTPF